MDLPAHFFYIYIQLTLSLSLSEFVFGWHFREILCKGREDCLSNEEVFCIRTDFWLL